MDDTGAPVSLDNLFGAVLRSFRKRGLRETAAKVPINFSHLAKWERGERVVPEEMVPILDQAYAANGALITLHELIKRDRLRATTAAMWGPPLSPLTASDAPRQAARRMFAAISTATGTPTPALHALEAADEQARASAGSSGDRELRVRVRAQRAHATYWAGRPLLEVARLVDEALRLGDGTPCPGLALAYAAGALLAAERGDADGVHAALGEFDAITGHLSPGPADDQALPGEELPAWACACHRAWPYLRVGDLAAASQALAEADKLCPPDFAGLITTLRLYRAHLLIVEGDIDHGLELTLSAVQSWPLTIAHRQVLTRLLAALPAQAHLHPAAQTLHHLLPRS